MSDLPPANPSAGPHRPDYRRAAPGIGSWLRRRWLLATVAVLVVGGAVAAGWWAEGRGFKTSALRRLFPDDPRYMPKPAILLVSPGERESGVMPDAYVRAEFSKPNGKGVDPATLKDSVLLLKGNARERVPAVVNTDAVGSVIVLRPLAPLEFNALYTFEVLPALKDEGGAAFEHFAATFSTAGGDAYSEFPAAGQKVEQPATYDQWYTGVAFGPDGRLYASTVAGQVVRFDVAPDGSLSNPKTSAAVLANNNGPRLMTGITFDPASTAERPVAYVAHGTFPFDSVPGAAPARSKAGTPHGFSKKVIPDWGGKISRLSGPNLDRYEDVVVGLPRARHDHTTGQIAFGPDGAMYVAQASNTAMGEPDKEWGFRPERLLTACVMRVDVKALAGRPGPLNVQTGEGGAYDPFAPGAPLTIYATGTRNCYDLLWHSSGRLYATLNGSARGGNTPGTPGDGQHARRLDATASGPYAGPVVPGLQQVGTQNDYLLRVEPGGYYGHPNPTRAEYVMNGGNPTAGPDPFEVAEYPPGTPPDRNWRRPAHDFGKNLSPNGLIEYAGDAFPALKGKVLAARFSGGKDVVALSLDPATGDVIETVSGLDGFTHFHDPVDLCQSPATGFLYVAEHTGKRITLVRPAGDGISRAIRVTTNPVAGSRSPVAGVPTWD